MGFLNKFPSYEYLIQNAIKAFERFPFTLLSAVLYTVVSVYLIEQDSFSKEIIAQKLILSAALGLPLFTALAVFAEKNAWTRAKSLLLQGAGLILLVMYFFSLPEWLDGPEMHGVRFALLLVGFHFMVSFLPYLSGNQVAGFWHFNKSLFLRFLQAALYSSVMYFGLVIALAAADYLFGMDVDEKSYFQLWVIIAVLFQSWLFLSGMPERYEYKDFSIDYPKALKIFTQYILLPLVGLYFVILIAYEAKIIIEWNWPKGWVSQLVLWYSVVGILSLLLLHPLKEKTGNSWIQIFSKWFFLALLPLVVMLMLAIFRRISDYGMTENRYFVLAMAIGLSVTVLYFIFSKRKDIRIIPIIICCLAFLSAYGPWSAFAVSKNNQMERLNSLLETHELLADGKVAKSDKEISFEDRKEISSIVQYVSNHYGLEPFVQMYPDTIIAVIDTFPNYRKAHLLVEELGFDLLSRWSNINADSYFYFSLENLYGIDISGYDYMEKLHRLQILDTGQVIEFNNQLHVISLSVDSMVWRMDVFHDSIQGTALETVLLSMPKDFFVNYESQKCFSIPVDQLTFDLAGKRAEAKIIIEQLNGSRSIDSLKISEMNGMVFLKEK